MNALFDRLGIEPNHRARPSDLVELESKLRVVLPQSYKDLVLYCDEASPQRPVFSYAGDAKSAISEFLSVTAEDSPDSVSRLARNLHGLPSGLIPIARDAGDWYICLDYRSGPLPTVAFLNPFGVEAYRVAATFDAFLEALRED